MTSIDLAYVAAILDIKARFNIVFARKKQFVCNIQIHATDKDTYLKILKELIPYSTTYILKGLRTRGRYYRWRVNVMKRNIELFTQIAWHLRVQKRKLNQMLSLVQANDFETKLRIYENES